MVVPHRLADAPRDCGRPIRHSEGVMARTAYICSSAVAVGGGCSGAGSDIVISEELIRERTRAFEAADRVRKSQAEGVKVLDF